MCLGCVGNTTQIPDGNLDENKVSPSSKFYLQPVDCGAVWWFRQAVQSSAVRSTDSENQIISTGEPYNTGLEREAGT